MTNYEFDAAYRNTDAGLFCGVDEAGRGPLAGPVYAAAVILPAEPMIDGLNDSKKLSEKKREALYDQICEKAIAWSVVTASVEEIDTLNILQATFLAMQRAVEGLQVQPAFALIDGNRAPSGLRIPCQTVVKGDALSASVAAASILAKVSRDRYLLELDAQYPQYAFKQHKGYGTKAHYAALEQYGPSPVHRMTFLRSFFAKQG